MTSEIHKIACLAALSALLVLPAQVATAEIGASVGVGLGGVGVNANVSLGGGGGTGADATVSLGGGGGGTGSSGGSVIDANVSLGGGGTGGGTGSTGGGIDVGVGVGIGGGAGGGTGGGTGTPGGGTMTPGDGTMVAGQDGATDLMLGNGMPAAALIGMVVYSSDNVMVGVVTGVVAFDGSTVRLAVAPSASLGVARRAVHLDLPMAQVAARQVTLAITAQAFAQMIAA